MIVTMHCTYMYVESHTFTTLTDSTKEHGEEDDIDREPPLLFCLLCQLFDSKQIVLLCG